MSSAPAAAADSTSGGAARPSEFVAFVKKLGFWVGGLIALACITVGIVKIAAEKNREEQQKLLQIKVGPAPTNPGLITRSQTRDIGVEPGSTYATIEVKPGEPPKTFSLQKGEVQVIFFGGKFPSLKETSRVIEGESPGDGTVGFKYSYDGRSYVTTSGGGEHHEARVGPIKVWIQPQADNQSFEVSVGN